MNYKSILTLLFVYVGLCGMDKPSYPWLEFVQAKCADNPAHARQPQNQAAALDSHAPQKSKGNNKKRKRKAKLSYECPECKEDFSRINELREHLLGQHTAYRPYACNAPGCSYKTAYLNCLKVHLSSKHKQDSPAALNLPLAAQKIVAENLRPLLVKMEWELECPTCNLLFSCQEELARHRRKHLNEARAALIPSPEIAPVAQVPAHASAREYEIFNNAHSEPDSIFYPQEETAPIHAQPADKEPVLQKYNPIVICNTKQKKNSATPSEFSCPECAKPFEIGSLMIAHILDSHARYYPYRCSMGGCPFETVYPHNFLKHMRKMHKQIGALQDIPIDHQREIASRLRPYLMKKQWTAQCPACTLLFPSERAMKQHEKSHLLKSGRQTIEHYSPAQPPTSASPESSVNQTGEITQENWYLDLESEPVAHADFYLEIMADLEKEQSTHSHSAQPPQ